MKKNTDPVHIREVRQNRMTRRILLVIGLFMLVGGITYFAGGNTTPVQTVLIVISAALYACSYSTLAEREWTIGMIPPAATALLLFLAARFGDSFTNPKPTAVNILLYAVFAALALVRLAFYAVQLAMLFSSFRTARKRREEYLPVILGTRLKNSQPGSLLKRRLITAVKYLKKHPAAKCIVTGGKIGDEPAAEADVMAQYLISAGISPDRIFIENRSTTTDENIRFCREIAEKENLSQKFLITTDRFHQLRAKLICRDNGVEAASLNSSAPLHLFLQYWAREVLCLAERWLTK